MAYNNVEDITDTILHEAGHALAGPGIGHDKVWQDICIRIGAKPERCYREHVVMPPSKYHAKCGKCQKEYDAHRMRQGKKYWCPKCGREDGKLLFSRRT